MNTLTTLKPPAPAPDRLALSPVEMAAALGLSERTLQDLRKRREIPFVKVGHRLLHPVDATRRWLDTLATEAAVENANAAAEGGDA